MLSKKVSEEIKSRLSGIDEKKMYQHMLEHYKLLKLVDNKGKWATQELQEMSTELLPKDITVEKSKKFVDEMVDLAQKNPYLNKFFEKASTQEFKHLSEKVKKEGDKVIPDAVAYSQVLDRLTHAMHQNPKVLEDCVKLFKAERKKVSARKHMSLFHKIKLYSVEDPFVNNVLIKANKTGKIDKKTGRFIVNLNILEATFGDYCVMGHKDNGKVGWELIMNPVGSTKDDPRTGAGPTIIAEDKKGICMFPPSPKKWNDLYQTWNMAFVSQMYNLPYIMPKLFIPTVAKYQEEPSKYLNKRALALYICCNHLVFQEIDRVKKQEPSIKWNDEKLTRLWGEVNLESAKEYRNELKAKKAEHVVDRSNAKKTRNVNMPSIESKRKKEAEQLKEKMLGTLVKNKEPEKQRCMS